MINYNYQLSLNVPSIEYTFDLPINFLIIKQPIYKYTTFYIANFLINDTKYNQLVNLFVNNRKTLDCYLTIEQIKEEYSCDIFDKNLLPTKTVKFIVKNKPLKIIKIKALERIPAANDRPGITLTQFIFADPKALILDTDFQFAKTFFNISPDSLLDMYSSILFSDYSIDTYKSIIPNTHKYIQIVVKSDISMLEFPFYLQKYYKITNNLPIIYYDSFASFDIFNHYEVFKIYDISKDNLNKLIKKDLSDTSIYARSVILKEDQLDHTNLSKIYQNEPQRLQLVKSDGEVIDYDISKQINIPSYKINNQTKRDYTIVNKTKSNTSIYRIHVTDNPDNAVKRFLSTINTYSSIKKTYRVRIQDDDPLNYDLGILYRFSKYEKYDSIFYNLCYYFYKNTGDFISCDIIGDIIQFEV